MTKPNVPNYLAVWANNCVPQEFYSCLIGKITLAGQCFSGFFSGGNLIGNTKAMQRAARSGFDDSKESRLLDILCQVEGCLLAFSVLTLLLQQLSSVISSVKR